MPPKNPDTNIITSIEIERSAGFRRGLNGALQSTPEINPETLVASGEERPKTDSTRRWDGIPQSKGFLAGQKPTMLKPPNDGRSHMN